MMKRILLLGMIGLILGACATPTVAPTPTPTLLLWPSPTEAKATLPPTWTATLESTRVPTRTPRPSSTPTLTRTPVPTRTPAPRRPAATATPTQTVVLTATQTVSLTATPATESPPPKVLIGEFDTTRALALLYDDPFANTRINVLLLEAFEQDGIDKYFLITEIPGDACPTCQASIGGAVFANVNNVWQIEASRKHITTLGTQGRAPEGRFIPIGPAAYGVRFQHTYSRDTEFGEYTLLISAVDDQLRVIFKVQTAAGQLAEPGSEQTLWAYDADIEFVEGTHPTHDDIQVTTRGTRPTNGQIETFEEVETFIYVKPEYRLAKSE